MIVFGGLLVVAGLITYIAGLGEAAGGWWLLSTGLVAAGLGVVLAGVVALIRRRLAPLRAVRQAARSGGAGGGPIARAQAVPRMLSASWRGEYEALPRHQTVLWLVALVYLVSPIDLLPELLPLIGISDDIGVGAWLLSSLYAESGNYLGQIDSANSDRGIEAD